MTKSWQTLPFEIVEQIIAHIESQHDLQQAQLTCKFWTAAAQNKFYETVHLLDMDRANIFIQTIQSSPQDLGTRVKTLTVMNKKYTIWPLSTPGFLNIFKSLVNLCPQVEVLNMSEFNHNWIWDHLMDELKNEKWMYFRYVSPPLFGTSEDFSSYTNALMVRQKINIQSMMIWNQNMQSLNTLSKNLHQFDRLKNLAIKLNESINVLDLEPILANKCNTRSLQSISFNCTHHIKPARQTKLLDHSTILDNNLGNLSTIHPYHHVKSFEADQILFTDMSFKYFMHKFPCLVKLSLGANGGHTMVKLHFSQAMMDVFISVLSKLESFDLKIRITTNSTTTIQQFFQTLADFPKKISILYSDDTRDPLKCPYIYARRNVKRYQNFFSREIQEFEDKEDGLIIFLSISPFLHTPNTAVVPHNQLILEVGDKLEELELNQCCVLSYEGEYWDGNEEEEGPFRAKLCRSVSLILERCTSLKKLSLESMDLRGYNFESAFNGVINQSIEMIHIVACLVDRRTFSTLFASLGSVKYFTLAGSWMQEEEDTYCSFFDMPSDTELETFHWDDYLIHDIELGFPTIYLKLCLTGEKS
jgi:hypothetical protein